MMALLYLQIDSGARVSEALSLTRKNADFDNLLVTLQGKGRKERRIPISIECRKRLYNWLASHDHDLVFCLTNGAGYPRFAEIAKPGQFSDPALLLRNAITLWSGQAARR